MYTVRFVGSSEDDLAKLSVPIRQRIFNRILWLGEHATEIRHRALTADLAGLYKLRDGDYRIIYEIVRKEKLILIHAVGHRSEIYRKR